MRYGLLDLIIDSLKWLLADKKERAFMSIPYNCQCCELLGMCRDEDNNWKCRNGCMILNYERKKKAYFHPDVKLVNISTFVEIKKTNGNVEMVA